MMPMKPEIARVLGLETFCGPCYATPRSGRPKVGCARQCSGRVSRRSKAAVAMVILALLAFTTIRTSPLYTGLESGSSLSSTHPKQRQFRVSEVSWTAPVLSQATMAPLPSGDAVLPECPDLPRECFFARCSDLPPPPRV